MKCPKCRAEIVSNTVKTCPYCGSRLAARSPENNKKVELVENHEVNKVAKTIKEAIEAQKAFYKPEKADITEKPKEVEKVLKIEKIEEVGEKKYSTHDIIIVFISLVLTFVILAVTLFLLLKRQEETHHLSFNIFQEFPIFLRKCPLNRIS